VSHLQASVYGWNPAFGRVLEKCGFPLEATLRDAIIKDAETTDEHIYNLIKNPREQTPAHQVPLDNKRFIEPRRLAHPWAFLSYLPRMLVSN